MKEEKQMDEPKNSCASSDHKESTWENIDWNKCEKAVSKLQARIVKAQKEGKFGKVKALQWTLTHSFYAKALAVRRVTSSHLHTRKKRLQASAFETNVHKEAQWQTETVGHPHNERQSNAGTLPTRLGTCVGNNCRQLFLWLQKGKRHCRRNGTLPHSSL